DPCTTACSGCLTCYTTQDPMVTFQNGFCTILCKNNSDCALWPNTTCEQLGDTTSYCLPACNGTSGPFCRTGYGCCNKGPPQMGNGHCAPTGSIYCGGL